MLAQLSLCALLAVHVRDGRAHAPRASGPQPDGIRRQAYVRCRPRRQEARLVRRHWITFGFTIGAIGVGLDDDERVAAIAKRAKQRGLLVYPEDDSLVMFPALTIDEATCGEALDILAAASR
jgi:hypothetical protein